MIRYIHLIKIKLYLTYQIIIKYMIKKYLNVHVYIVN